jgi:micrococcal nuclease
VRLLKNILLLAAFGLAGANALALPYRVVGVTDGDTLKVLDADKRQLTCRLYGIDAPEKSQAFGQAAKTALSTMTFNRMVEIDITGRDRYNRAICKIKVGGLDVNKELVAKGMAWMYRRYTNDPAYHVAESAARTRLLGVWVDPQAIPPWDYRKGNKRVSGQPSHLLQAFKSV